ncbi:MAG: hypothetical protein ACFBSE_27440 [Prochloraceae cyanobacterium]
MRLLGGNTGRLTNLFILLYDRVRRSSRSQQQEPSISKTSDRKEPDWSTFPHLTSNDPRAAKNRVEKIASAIVNLTISEGADALYSQFKFGEVEWAKENYLTNREIALLEQLNNCKHLNLFEDESGETQSDCRF